MSDFAPPSGPPPPKVPEGWKAVWNDQYKEWFYVNLHTKQSTWEKPSDPAPKPDASADGLPSYSAGSNAPQVSDTKKSNNPYNQTETDEQMARRLQAEEDQRRNNAQVSSDRGASDSYYNSGSGPGYQSNQSQPGAGYTSSPQYSQAQPQAQSQDKGLFGKLKNKLGGGGMSGGRPPQAYGGGYPQQYQQGYPPQQGYGGYPPQGYGGYGQQPMYAQQPPRKSGLGAGGAAALGVGGGLIGGMLLADAIEDHDQHEYQEGYQDGQMNDNGGGYDNGGGFDDGGGFDGGDF